MGISFEIVVAGFSFTWPALFVFTGCAPRASRRAWFRQDGMTDAYSIALSGLRAQTTRLAATASNIANVSTSGAVPSADPSAPASTVYRPLNVSYSSLESGGVAAHVNADPQGYTISYEPDSVYANSDGLVAAPAVDLNREVVNLIESKLLYKANVSVIKTQDEMMGDLLDSIA